MIHALVIAAAMSCGTERWAVKTMADKAETKVVLRPQATSVAELRARQAPPSLDRSSPRFTQEDREVQIPVVFLGFKLEGDSDYHMVIADPGDQESTMIAESPDRKCSAASDPVVKEKIAAVHAAVATCFGVPPDNKMRWFASPIKGTVTGIEFFDVLHGQTGVAPNGIEVHPILRIRIDQCLTNTP